MAGRVYLIDFYVCSKKSMDIINMVEVKSILI